MAIRTPPERRRAHTAWPDSRASVVSILGVAAGYGLAISAPVVLTMERVFGPRGTAGRLEVLAMTVGILVAGAAVVHARRFWQHRRR